MPLHSRTSSVQTRSALQIMACHRVRWLLILQMIFLMSQNAKLSIAQSSVPKASSKTFTAEIHEQMEQERLQESAQNQFLEKRSKNFGVLSPETPQALQTRYQRAFEDFRGVVGKIHQVFLSHQVAWTTEYDIQRLELYSQLLNEAQQRLDGWRVVIAEIYAAAPEGSKQLTDMVFEMLERDAGRDMFEGLLPMARSVLEHASDIPTPILESIGFIGYGNNDLDLAEAAWMKLKERQALSEGITKALETLPEQRAKWKQELKRRAADSARNTNPQVAILTSKGQIVVELFEEEAPQAVANFIFLVEKRFYDKKMFFRVIEHFGSQSGCEKADGSGNAGYTIRGEMDADNHRNIFRGSLVLLSGIDEQTKQFNPDSGSSQFLISTLPQPASDGKMTVFGRVIEGLPVLGAWQRLDLTRKEERNDKSVIPDLIIRATVLRKRNHPYVPEAVSGRLP
ncbi:MAG: peptidylprolyl isomerase [Pirellulaceae bacterium]|nr:peptidylprolyl isomerase [Pirellulaceae bacterium]